MFRLIVMVGAFLAVWPAVAKQWREDRAGFWKTVWLMLCRLLRLGRRADFRAPHQEREA